MPVRGDARYRVTQKLEPTRRRLLRWNKKEIGDIFRRLETTKMTIAELQDHEDREEGLTDRELADLRRLLAEQHSLLRQQELFWKQSPGCTRLNKGIGT